MTEELAPVKRTVGQRGKDVSAIRKKWKPKYTDLQKEYWKELINMVDKTSHEYLKHPTTKQKLRMISPKRKEFLALTLKEFIETGVAYFKFALRYDRNMSINGLCLFLNVSPNTVTRMEQKTHDGTNYRSDVFIPILRKFKTLIGLFHEEMGSDKMNPNFHIYMLKVMREGFEESVDVNVNEPEGLTEEERLKLREKVSHFTEVFTAKRK